MQSAPFNVVLLLSSRKILQLRSRYSTGSLRIGFYFQSNFNSATRHSSILSMTALPPNDTDSEQLTNEASAAIPLRATCHPPLGEQSSCPDSEKHQDVSSSAMTTMKTYNVH